VKCELCGKNPVTIIVTHDLSSIMICDDCGKTDREVAKWLGGIVEKTATVGTKSAPVMQVVAANLRFA
jgi:ribosome-binding protein aMBF1 (putative translation factor)